MNEPFVRSLVLIGIQMALAINKLLIFQTSTLRFRGSLKSLAFMRECPKARSD